MGRLEVYRHQGVGGIEGVLNGECGNVSMLVLADAKEE